MDNHFVCCLKTTLEHRVRFELTVLRVCNPFPWASRAPVHMAEAVRFELTDLLQSTVFKTAALNQLSHASIGAPGGIRTLN